MFDLQSLRKEHRITQKDAAILLGCKQPNISAIENDGKDLTEEQLNILIDKYGKENVMRYYTESGIVSDEHLHYGSHKNELQIAFEIMKKQADSLERKDQQIDRLITLIENSLNK